MVEVIHQINNVELIGRVECFAFRKKIDFSQPNL
jgi:hypothetical protein